MGNLLGDRIHYGVLRDHSQCDYIEKFVIDYKGVFEMEVRGWRKWRWTKVYGELTVEIQSDSDD